MVSNNKIELEEIRVRNKRGRVLAYNPWNRDAEPGDIMVSEGRAWRLYTRKDGPRACAGELSMRELKKQGYIAYKEVGNETGLIWRRNIGN